MKTPDEIKLLKERLRLPTAFCYQTATQRMALEYIEQLERERDAAVDELKEFDCATCKHCNMEHIASICCKCKDASNWEWRGVKEE